MWPPPDRPVVLAGFALQQTDPFSLVGRVLDSPYTKAALAATALVVAALYLALVLWTYRDAARRGASRLPWTLASLLFPFLGPLVYLLLRPPDYALDVHERELELLVLDRVLAEGTRRCPRCENLVRSDFLGCPHCRMVLKEECEGCGRALEDEWQACPYCLRGRRSVSGGPASDRQGAGQGGRQGGGPGIRREQEVAAGTGADGRPGADAEAGEGNGTVRRGRRSRRDARGDSSDGGRGG